MLYARAEERKRARWKKFWLKQMLLEESTFKMGELRKHGKVQKMRKAQ